MDLPLNKVGDNLFTYVEIPIDERITAMHLLTLSFQAL